MKWEVALAKWRKDRNLSLLQPNYIDMMQEERQELLDAITWDERVDAICDQLVLTENAIEQTRPLLSSHYAHSEFADSPTLPSLLAQYVGDQPDDDFDVLLAIKQQLLSDLTDLGVVPDLALKQTVKHISSRIQCSIQSAEWAQSGPVGKWQKSRSQDPESIYQPNYKLCKQ